MAEDEILPMLDEFPSWYRPVAFNPDPELIQHRWAGVCAIVKEVTMEDVEAMIRVAFRSRQHADAKSLERIRHHFKQADESFQMNGNDRELEILCGAILAQLCQKCNPPGAALAVTTTAVEGGRRPHLPFDLVAMAEDNIRRAADRARQRPDLSKLSTPTKRKIDLGQSAQKYRDEQNVEGFTKAFSSAAEVLDAALAKIREEISIAVGAADRFIRIQDEELQMLWWLVGGQSFDLGYAFSAIPAGAQPLVFGKELANMTGPLPGPVNISALLLRAGVGDSSEMTIVSAVNACDEIWLGKIGAAQAPSAVTLPIHFAISRKLETGDQESWVAGWAAAAEIDPEQRLSPIAIGRLFYRERLLAKPSVE